MQVNRKKNLRFSPFKANQYFNVRFCVGVSAAAALWFFAMTKLTKLANSSQNLTLNPCRAQLLYCLFSFFVSF